MELHFDVTGGEELMAQWRRAPEIVQQELLATITEADNLLLGEVQDMTPHGATNALRGSIIGRESVGPDGVLGEVGSPLAYAIAVELGTKPHFPPIEPLMDWVRAKLGVREEREVSSAAYAIAHTIAQRGTLAVGMFHRTFAAKQSDIDAMFVQARERIFLRLGGAA